MVQTVITEAIITTLTEAETQFFLQRTEEVGFFVQWHADLTATYT